MEEEIRVTLIATGFDDRVDRRGAGTVIRPSFAAPAAGDDFEEPAAQEPARNPAPAGRQAEPGRVRVVRQQQPVRAVAAGGAGPAGFVGPFPQMGAAAARAAQVVPGQARPADARPVEAPRSVEAPRPASVVIRARKGGAVELELPTFIRR